MINDYTEYRQEFENTDFNYYMDVQVFYDSLYLYADKVQDMIDESIKGASQQFRKILALHSESETAVPQKEVEAQFIDYMSKGRMRDLYYNSLIITIYSFVEVRMANACRYLEKDRALKLNDMQGKGIHKSHRYLTKVCQFNFTAFSTEWDNLINYSLVRNHIVHSHGLGSVSKENQLLVKFLREMPGVTSSYQESEKMWFFTLKTDDIIKNLIGCSLMVINGIYLKD